MHRPTKTMGASAPERCQWVLTVGSYWLLGLLFLVADMSKSFSWMRRYKVQAVEMKPTLQDLVPVVRQVVFNQVFVQLPVNVLFYWLKDLRGFDRSLSLPSLSRTMVHFACFVAIEEALFYYSHRFRGNYGILGILDWLHGTDGAFRQSEAYQRHRLLLSFRPVHELYPDTGGRRDLPTEGRSTTQSHG
ncbi:hypothetical protein HPB51_001036 [Rhipicephalus microplus]|uniref:Uncharacterized protein n=1 Tax=Rhipicephalus microplus TaxID=6941 RepID=A0A9J6DRG7_RHIMP|nr:hypothetical protein HPB51_001036 [Rhipicephalus microplus]